jgi:tetratricopeptide (TPR) repeat protein
VSGECHQLLTLAAGIGHEFNFAVLKNVIRAAHDERPEESDSTGSPLLKSLDEALAARLLTAVPGSVGRYSFSHALIRATLYESLSIAQRLHLHRRIGEALETLAGARPEPWLPELAHHFFQAVPGGTADKAIAYARLAAERATASLAYEEAAAHYEHVLQLLDARTSEDERRCAMLLALGEAQRSAGNPTAARSAFHQAAELARRLLQQPGISHPASLLARAALGFGGMLLMNSVGDPDVITFLEEALSALGEEDSSLRARVLARLAMEIRRLPVMRSTPVPTARITIERENPIHHVLLLPLGQFRINGQRQRVTGNRLSAREIS